MKEEPGSCDRALSKQRLEKAVSFEEIEGTNMRNVEGKCDDTSVTLVGAEVTHDHVVDMDADAALKSLFLLTESIANKS